MNVVQIGDSPVLHSAQSFVDSTIRITPHLDDARNDLRITPKVFNQLYKKLGRIAVDIGELNALLAQKKKEHRKFVEAKVKAVEDGDVKERQRVLEKYRTRQFRVLIHYEEKETDHRWTVRYELRRYVVRYDELKRETHSTNKDGCTINYATRIVYNLVHGFGTTRQDPHYSIQCSANATQLENESGSPFATSMWRLTRDQWKEKLLDVYRKPYRILAMVAGMEADDLMKFTAMDRGIKPIHEFSLGVSDEEMVDAIRIHTFGFRWMMSFRPADTFYMEEQNKEWKRSKIREMMLLMIYSLYNSKRKFLNRDVSVSHNMNIDVEVSRKSDMQDGLFDYANPREEDVADGVEERLRNTFEKQQEDPLRALRIRIKGANRVPLYTLSFTIPSAKYLQQTYRMTDGLRNDGKERTEELKAAWREMAEHGVMLGVDAYSGYLRDRKAIGSLGDLVSFFERNYELDIQKFCQDILEQTYMNIDIQYWVGCGWMPMVKMDAIDNVKIEDKAVWKWLDQHPDLNITDFMVKKNLLGKIEEKGGKLHPTKDQMKLVRAQVDYWRKTYGYDPSYSMGAHIEIIKSWSCADNPQRFYSLEKQGVGINQRIFMTQKMMTEGFGAMLPKMVLLPVKPPAKPARVAAA